MFQLNLQAIETDANFEIILNQSMLKNNILKQFENVFLFGGELAAGG